MHSEQDQTLKEKIMYDPSKYTFQIHIIKVSGKLPTYPSPKLAFCPKCEVSVNIDLGEG